MASKHDGEDTESAESTASLGGASAPAQRTKSKQPSGSRSLERFSTGPLSQLPLEIQREALVTTEEVAAFIGVSPLTVARWRSSGDGPMYLRLKSNAIRYVLGDVIDFVRSRRVRHTSEERQTREGLNGGVGW